MLSDDGPTLRARKAYERGEFLASTDERFRPVYLRMRPTARCMSSTCIAGSSSIACRSRCTCATTSSRGHSKQPTRFGRIYRVVHDTTRRDTTTMTLSQASPAQLVEMLSHPSGWWRDTAQRLLVERADTLRAGPAAWKSELSAERTVGRPDADEAGCGRSGLADSSPRAVDARRDRRDRAGHWSSGRWMIPSRDVRVVGDPHRGAMAGRSHRARFMRRC